MTIPCHQIPYAVASGAANMALDEAILEWVASRKDAAFLRTYGWIEPTLTLGYFQSLSEALTESRWREVPLVRRPTGGGAIWHDHELTYSVVLPAHHALARPSSVFYQAVHAAIATTLRSQDLDARRRADLEPTPRHAKEQPQGRPFLCFTDRDPEDIVVNGFKVLGSAQRRHSGAILQHGSLLLKRSDRTPELPGLGDLSERSWDPRSWTTRVEQSIIRELRLELVAGDLPAGIPQRASELEKSVYQSAFWTARR